jgi:hypothetical protein
MVLAAPHRLLRRSHAKAVRTPRRDTDDQCRRENPVIRAQLKHGTLDTRRKQIVLSFAAKGPACFTNGHLFESTGVPKLRLSAKPMTFLTTLL